VPEFLPRDCPLLTLRTQSLLTPVKDFGTFLGCFWSQFCGGSANTDELPTRPRNKKPSSGE